MAGSEIEFARPDLERLERCGMPEVVYGEGKSAAQIVAIVRALNRAGQSGIVTRICSEKAAEVGEEVGGSIYYEDAKILASMVGGVPDGVGLVAVLCAGTSDLRVAEEAAVTATLLGARVERIYDVGVAGVHRLLEQRERFCSANAIVVVAGMEGALPSVVGGLTERPVVAVPTSVGYGASFGGVAALLGMLNTCAAGVTVVNIDNGFGAGVAAARINKMCLGERG